MKQDKGQDVWRFLTKFTDVQPDVLIFCVKDEDTFVL